MPEHLYAAIVYEFSFGIFNISFKKKSWFVEVFPARWQREDIHVKWENAMTFPQFLSLS